MEELAYRQFVSLERDHWWFRGRRSLVRRLSGRWLPQAESARIVDVGSGAGGMLPVLAGFGRPLAVEPAVRFASACLRRGHPVVCADAVRLPLVACAADVVTFLDVLEHLDDEASTLAGAFRLLRPGGTILITVPAYGFLFSDNDVISGHRRRYTRGRLLELLRGGGFEPVFVTYYNALLLPLIGPIVLAGKLSRTLGLRRRPPSTTNLSWPVPGWLNRVLSVAFELDVRLAARVPLPFGHSLAVVARRPGG